MGKIIKLVEKNKNAKSWGVQDVVDELQRRIDNGDMPAGVRFMAVYANPPTKPEFNTNFVQCGMSASEAIALLEIAKLDLYRNQMVKP